MLVPTIVLVSDSVAAFRDSVCCQFALFFFVIVFFLLIVSFPERKNEMCIFVAVHKNIVG